MLKEDDDSVQTNANPRYVKKSCDFLVKKCNNVIPLFPVRTYINCLLLFQWYEHEERDLP